MTLHHYLKLCRKVQGVYTRNPETMPSEPTLFLDDQEIVCYFGDIKTIQISGISSYSGTINDVRLFRKNKVNKIEITPKNITFTLTTGSQYSIPHTPKTYKELVEIYGEQ